MNKRQKVSFGLFIGFFLVSIAVSNMIATGIFEMPDKPWQMQPKTDENVLTQDYLEEFEILGKSKIIDRITDSTDKVVNILVDAWGVPFDIAKMKEDFALFSGVVHKEFLHPRVANRTRHAEFVELRNPAGNGLYLFGGDSLEYGRDRYLDSLGYTEKIFCQSCKDSVMLAKLDSVLQFNDCRVFAVTTQDSRNGDRNTLRYTLRKIALLAAKYPNVRFIVQGSHRPILGEPKIRKTHFAKWVPTIILN